MLRRLSTIDRSVPEGFIDHQLQTSVELVIYGKSRLWYLSKDCSFLQVTHYCALKNLNYIEQGIDRIHFLSSNLMSIKNEPIPLII